MIVTKEITYTLEMDDADTLHYVLDAIRHYVREDCTGDIGLDRAKKLNKFDELVSLALESVDNTTLRGNA